MPILQPSFRGRLRLFFAVIVIVPIIAVGVVLFQLLGATDNFRLDSGLDKAQVAAQNTYTEDRRQAIAAMGPIRRDVQLARAIEERDKPAIQERLNQLARAGGARVVLAVTDLDTFTTPGTGEAVAAASAELENAGGTPIGRLTVSTTTANGYATDVARQLEVGVRVDRDGAVLATTIPRAANTRIPNKPGAEVTVGPTDYRTTAFTAPEPDDTTVTVRLLGEIPAPDRSTTSSP
jgi:hypothetical protein